MDRVATQWGQGKEMSKRKVKKQIHETGTKAHSQHRRPTVVDSAGVEGDKPISPFPPKARLGDSVTRRQFFAQNLDRLLAVVGLSRKRAAEDLGVPYPLIRRFVSSGISRRDERNADYLEKIASYFGLPDVEALWRADLLPRLLASGEERGFVHNFRSRLEAQRQLWLAKLAEVDRDLLNLVSKALGQDNDHEGAEQFGEDLAKVRTILRSSRAGGFRQLIDDYCEFVSAKKMISLKDSDDD
jgi:hypothetical protein